MGAFTSFGGKGPLLLGLTWTWTCLATALIVLRTKTASRVVKGGRTGGFLGLRWDFVLVAWENSVAITAQCLLTVSILHGTGNHMVNIHPQDAVACDYYSWIAQIVAIIGIASGRLAVIALLLMVQGPTHSRLIWVLYVVGGLQAVINVVAIVLILLQCKPVEKLWDPTIPGTCDFIEICTRVGFLQGGLGAFADLVLAIYPIFIVGQLRHMKFKIKAGLCVVMGGGFIAAIASINKTVQISRILELSDLTYATWVLLAWVWTEMWFIIIFGSLPALRRLVTGTQRPSNSDRAGGSGYDSKGFRALEERERSKVRFDDIDWLELSTVPEPYNQQKSRYTANITMMHDDGSTSQENILPPSRANLRRTEVDVESISRVY